jgi:trimeric autotransporter adhesin
LQQRHCCCRPIEHTAAIANCCATATHAYCYTYDQFTGQALRILRALLDTGASLAVIEAFTVSGSSSDAAAAVTPAVALFSTATLQPLATSVLTSEGGASQYPYILSADTTGTAAADAIEAPTTDAAAGAAVAATAEQQQLLQLAEAELLLGSAKLQAALELCKRCSSNTSTAVDGSCSTNSSSSGDTSGGPYCSWSAAALLALAATSTSDATALDSTDADADTADSDNDQEEEERWPTVDELALKRVTSNTDATAATAADSTAAATATAAAQQQQQQQWAVQAAGALRCFALAASRARRAQAWSTASSAAAALWQVLQLLWLSPAAFATTTSATGGASLGASLPVVTVGHARLCAAAAEALCAGVAATAPAAAAAAAGGDDCSESEYYDFADQYPSPAAVTAPAVILWSGVSPCAVSPRSTAELLQWSLRALLSSGRCAQAARLGRRLLLQCGIDTSTGSSGAGGSAALQGVAVQAVPLLLAAQTELCDAAQRRITAAELALTAVDAAFAAAEVCSL